MKANMNGNAAVRERLVCTNPDCRREFLVAKTPGNELNRQCACGGQLKKAYNTPQLRVLEDSERLQIEGFFSLRRSG
jgi:hypothetical protein